MTTVYIVTYNIPYEGSDIEAVFADYDSAVSYIKNIEEGIQEDEGEWLLEDGNYFQIESHEIGKAPARA